ncbi:MAG: DNA-binding protein [Tissierellaceae bacterium]|nr:DNA-binding protein [Tissierellaceae bacterium]
MEFKKIGDKYVVRLDKGEEIVESIKALAVQEEISLGTITGIGAVDRVKVGVYKLNTKEYFSKEYEGDMEIVNLAGSISQMDGEVYLHLHIALSDISYGIFGGHLNHGYISATGEIIIQSIDGKINRKYDHETGLNLIDFYE